MIVNLNSEESHNRKPKAFEILDQCTKIILRKLTIITDNIYAGLYSQDYLIYFQKIILI